MSLLVEAFKSWCAISTMTVGYTLPQPQLLTHSKQDSCSGQLISPKAGFVSIRNSVCGTKSETWGLFLLYQECI